ncbi:MAG TPA: efflux RND transporter periplasmic adaptor subunit [Gammaproteobacteria bacterium]|nr:efflux RND transporter periplasmic adaptor subunit [Gammaproteobacteria bacterium]
MSEKGTRDEVDAGAPGEENIPAIARLCYVDDSRTSAYVVKRLLKPFGYQVDHFVAAEPAFVAMVQEDYDLLLTDLKVSPTGMDGDDLIRTLRQSGHPKISVLPIIVITGATDAEALVKVYEAGANQVMKKPVDADELDGHIRRLLFDVKRITPKVSKVDPADVPRKPTRRSGDATVVPLRAAQRPLKEAAPAAAEARSQDRESQDRDIPVLNRSTEAPAGQTPKRPVRPVKKAEQKSSIDKPVDASPASTDTVLPAKGAAVADDTGRESSITRAMEDTTAPDTSASGGPKATADALEHGTAQKRETQREPVIPEQTITGSGAHKPSSADPEQEEPVIIEPDMRAGREGRKAARSEDENILSEIEQYPLIVDERGGLFSGSRWLNMLQSLVELVGVRNLLVRGLTVGLVLVALLTAWNMYYNPGIPVDTVLVESGEIFQSITVPGRIVSKQRVNVSAARAGRLVEILVNEGDNVKKGQLLARIDDRALLSRLNRVKANLAAAREDITLAKRTLDRLRKAHAKGAVARRFVEDAEVELRTARNKAKIAAEEVRSATLDFENQKIKAPFGGTVTARYAEIGQWVGPTETLFTLVDESQREIEVRVDAADSVAIDVGQVVVVSSDAFPGLEWQESVTRLGAEAGGKSNANTVKVYISLGNDAPVFRYGQQVDADIRTAWNPNTLKVPFEALISRDGQTMVAVMEDGHVRMKIVETGIEDFAMAEIKQGLNAGERVIIPKGLVLHNGDRVHLRRNNE